MSNNGRYPNTTEFNVNLITTNKNREFIFHYIVFFFFFISNFIHIFVYSYVIFFRNQVFFGYIIIFISDTLLYYTHTTEFFSMSVARSRLRSGRQIIPWRDFYSKLLLLLLLLQLRNLTNFVHFYYKYVFLRCFDVLLTHTFVHTVFVTFFTV